MFRRTTLTSELTKTSFEESYRLNQATYHQQSNSYRFKHNEQWIHTQPNHRLAQDTKKIAVRAIKLIRSYRSLTFGQLYLQKDTQLANITLPIQCPSSFTMSDIVDLYKTETHKLYDSMIIESSLTSTPNIFLLEKLLDINYDGNSKTLSFGMGLIVNNTHFVLGHTAGSDLNVSNDFKNTVGIHSDQFWIDLSLLTHGDPSMHDFTVLASGVTKFEAKYASFPFKIQFNNSTDRKVIGFDFTNVWSREALRVDASFVNLTNDRFLGYTDASYNPPKEYSIKDGSFDFDIQLFDSVTNEPIQLPDDKKDQLVIEAIMLTN